MRSIAGAFDAEALDESKTAHRVCIEWVIENSSSTQMLKLDAEGFDAWILEPSRNWMSTDFNIDVFGDIWVELYPELSHHFDAEMVDNMFLSFPTHPPSIMELRPTLTNGAWGFVAWT